MTSYTRKLYNTDPAAAEAFRRAQEFERQLAYGKAFGKRLPTGQQACMAPCGHPACVRGCTLR